MGEAMSVLYYGLSAMWVLGAILFGIGDKPFMSGIYILVAILMFVIAVCQDA